MANEGKEREIAFSLLETDDLGLISWESIIDDLSTNLYVDEKKTGDNTYNGSRKGFDQKFRTTILAADATGTLQGEYLNPRPLINKLGQTYREARHDEIPMNIRNMDYTNKIKKEDEEEESEEYMVGSLTLEELYHALDVCNDGVLGIDDALAVRNIYAIYLTHAEAHEVEFFKQIFEPITETALNEIMTEQDTNWDVAFEHTLEWDSAGQQQEHLTYDNYHNKGSQYAYNVIYTNKNGDAITPGVYPQDESYFYVGHHLAKVHGVDDDDPAKYYEFITFYVNDLAGSCNIEDCANTLMSKIIKIKRQGRLVVDTTLASTILYLIANAKGEGHEDKAYITFDEFSTFVQEHNVFPMSDADKLKRYLNLLMPRYSRRVEVEDLDKNFWVIGQVLDALAEAVWRDDGIVDAIQAIIKQLNNVTNQVNALNILLGLNGDTTISLRGGAWATMTNGYDLTNLVARIQRGNGTRDIAIPITSSYNMSLDNYDYSSWKNYVKSWNKPPSASALVSGWNPGSRKINVYDLYASENVVPCSEIAAGTSYPINTTRIAHPFYYSLAQTSVVSWYYSTLKSMCNNGDEFKFVQDVNILMYNPNYYSYNVDDLNNPTTFTITETTVSDKTQGKQKYTYDITKVLAYANKNLAELELIMINFNPKQAATDKIAIDASGTMPTNSFNSYNPLDMHYENGARTSYRYNGMTTGIRNAKPNEKIGIGIQYFSPALIDKDGSSLRKSVKVSNILSLRQSMMNSRTSETSSVSQRSFTAEFLSGGAPLAVHTMYGESGRIGACSYVVSANSYDEGVSQGSIAQFLTYKGIALSSYAGDSSSLQARCFVNGSGNIVKYGSKYLPIKNSLGGLFDTITKDGTVLGWKSKNVMTLGDFIDFTGNEIYTPSSNKIAGIGNIRSFVEGIGLQYGNAFAVAEFPNEINPSMAPRLITDFITEGDAHVSDIRHSRQIIFIPIYYSRIDGGYNDTIYLDLTKCGIVMFNWLAQSESQMTANSGRRFIAKNLDNYWLDGNGNVSGNSDGSHVPIGFAIICAAAGMPDFTNPPANTQWASGCATVDTSNTQLFGKSVLGTYIFETSSQGDTSGFNMPHFALSAGGVDIDMDIV